MSILFNSVYRGILEGASSRKYRCTAVFMNLNDEQHFVANRNVTVPKSPWPSDDTAKDLQSYTNQLLNNDGKYFRLHGRCLNPFDFLKWMKDNKYQFERDCRRLKVNESSSGFVDVKGNLLQVSSAFHYRFYDSELLQNWLDEVSVVDPKSLTNRAA